MNRYIHDSGLEISMQESFALMNHAQNNTIKSIGRLLTERPGFKEGSFIVDTEKVRSPGGTVQQYLVVTCGDAFFPNSEVFIASPYEVRVPIEQAPGYRYLILKYRAMRQSKGKFSERFKPDNEYLFADDYVALFVRNKAILAIDGSEMILARFLYTAVMSEPQIDMNRPRYSNAWSIAEAMPSNQPSISVVQILHDMLRKTLYASKPLDTLVFIPTAELFLQAASEMLIPSPPYRAFKITKATMGNGQSHLLSQMLPMREIGNYHRDSIRMFPGITYNVSARNVDLYRGTLGDWSEEVETIGGFSASGTPTLNLESGYFEGMDAIWVRAYFELMSDIGGVFVQLWVTDNDSVPNGEPILEVPMRSFLPTIRHLIPIAQGLEEAFITARLVDATNTVLKTQTQALLLPPPSISESGNFTYTMTFGRDAFHDGTCLFRKSGGAESQLFRYKNVSGKTEYIVKAKLTNYAEDEGSSTPGQVVSADPYSGVILEFDNPAAPPPPYQSEWLPSPDNFIELPSGNSITFCTNFVGDNVHCDFFGTIQLMIARSE